MTDDSNKATVEKRLNAIASTIPLLEKSDLAPFNGLLDEFDALKKEVAGRPAFITLITRARTLVENIVMQDVDFNAGCAKLGKCVEKMLKAVGGEQRTPEADGHETTDNRAFPDDLQQIVVRFANNQQGVLEDFEAHILDLEKGDPQAKQAIRRIMHTWKGEFGVLDLQDYAKLIHELEDRLDSGILTSENLFRLKDFLADRLPGFAAGACPPITEEEKSDMCGGDTAKTPGRPDTVQPRQSDTQDVRHPAGAEGPTPEESLPATPPERPFTGDPSLLADFIRESSDHLHTAETMLLDLESAPDNMDAINSVFRAWHTIKGVAAFMALKEIQELAHAMESMMDRARKGELRLQAAGIDALLAGNDMLKAFLVSVEEALSSGVLKIPPDYDNLMQRLRHPEPQNTPDEQPASVAQNKKLGEILVESGAASRAAVESALERQQRGDDRKLGEILIDEQDLPARAVGGALAAQTSARTVHGIEETIRVPVNRIDQLVDTIGEAVIAQSMIYAHPAIAGLADQSVHTKIAHGAMIMRQIQEMAMSLRMVSVKATFQKMTRLARDLSKRFGRDLDFITEGEDTALDKSVVENIGDPLIHMIRNAIDHGIEPTAERIAAGKPAKATVRLKAYHRAGNIYIEVSDDGKGLDRDAILAKAMAKGLCRPEQRLTDAEIFGFIFLPGFSTAKVVTDVSGRGVGMDVVRRNIEALRGSCEIASVAGKGTTFTIRLPLTLAIVDGMIVKAGNENYIIPTLAIIESMRPAPGQVETVMRRNAIVKVRDDLIPLVHLIITVLEKRERQETRRLHDRRDHDRGRHARQKSRVAPRRDRGPAAGGDQEPGRGRGRRARRDRRRHHEQRQREPDS